MSQTQKPTPAQVRHASARKRYIAEGIIEDAKALLDLHNGWAPGRRDAVDAEKNPVSALDPKAFRFSLNGAMIRSAGSQIKTRHYVLAQNAVRLALYPMTPPEFNACENTTKRDIVKALDVALKLLKARRELVRESNSAPVFL